MDRPDYKEFQERIMGRTLLVNAPIESVEAKSVNSSRLRQESEKQYLRLWAQNGAQTIMYHANSQPSAPIYVEHDGKLLLIVCKLGGHLTDFNGRHSGTLPPQRAEGYLNTLSIGYQADRPAANIGSLTDVGSTSHRLF